MVHRNFEATEEMVNNLLAMGNQLDNLEQMLAADKREIVGPAPNLLVIHYHLNQLERFRNQTMHEAKKASPSSQVTLTRWFEPLNKLIAEFDEFIIELAKNTLNLVRAGHPEVVVKFVKIAEIEGREDEKVALPKSHAYNCYLFTFDQALAMRFVKKAAKLDAALKFKSLQANARVIKHYRSKILKAITLSIHDRMENAYSRLADDPVKFLGGLQWLYRDILRVESEVVPCFPADYDIYSVYIREYHKALNVVVKKIAEAKSDASVLLALYEWLKEYKDNMKELKVAAELLDPPLLDGKEQSLIEDYVQLIIRKLDEWSANLMKTEISEFTKRGEAPELDSDNIYSMQVGVILFQMVNQQVDLAADSGQGAILARVVSESNRVMRSIQDQWVKTVDSEFKKQIEKPEEVAGGLVEYCIALANDQVKSADFCEAMLGRLEPLVSEKYRVTINERLNDAIDGYLDVAKKCMQTLIDMVFNDLKPATKNLFQPPWYDGIMRQIVETMKDYMADYQSYLNSALLELMTEDLMDAFIVSYLNALANAPKLRMPAAAERFKEDVTEVFEFFTTLSSAKDVEARFEVLELVLSMLEASKEIVFLSIWNFAKVHGLNIAFVESLMKARSDIDRSTVNEIMDILKRKVKDDGLTDR